VKTKLMFVLLFLISLACVLTGVLLNYLPIGNPTVELIMPNEKRDPNIRLFVRHCLTTAIKDGWKAEAWLGGSEIEFGGQVPISIRLTPGKKIDLKEFLKVQVHLKIHLKIVQVKGGIVREADLIPQFRECAKMNKSQELDRVGGEYSKTYVDFPPAEPAWEAGIDEAFGFDKIVGAKVKEAAGQYLMTIELQIESGPRIVLDGMPVSFDFFKY
jgi:hypothetical protein